MVSESTQVRECDLRRKWRSISRIERYSTLLTMHSHVMLNNKTMRRSQIQILFTWYFVLTTGRHVKLHFVENLCLWLCVCDIWWHDIFASPQFTELCKNAVSFHSDQFSHSITHSNTWRKQKQHNPLHCFCHWNFNFIIKLDLLLVSLIIYRYRCNRTGLSCQGITKSWKKWYVKNSLICKSSLDGINPLSPGSRWFK